MKRALIITVVVAALAIGAGTVLAGGFGHGHGGPGMAAMGPHGPGMMLRGITRILHRLDLSDAQRDQVHAILEGARPQFEPHVEALRAGRDQLMSLDPAQFDEAKVRTIAEGQAKEMTEVIVLAQKVRSQVFAVLTPEQQTEAVKIRSELKERRQRMRDCMKGAGGPPAE